MTSCPPGMISCLPWRRKPHTSAQFWLPSPRRGGVIQARNLRRNGRQKGVVGKLRNGKEDTIMALELTSSAISANQPIPKMYTCEGEGISPPLAWSGVLQNTAVFALIVDDPDAPRGVFTHWVLFNLSGDISQLEMSIPRTDRLENGASQGLNDFGDIGYGAPCPPKGDAPHHYRFTLYALD